MTRKTRRTK